MYNNNELYEINIDKLAYSLEHGIELSVEDYIDYPNEVFSVEKLKLTEEQLKESKKEMEQLLSDMHNRVSNFSFLKTSVYKKLLNDKKISVSEKDLENTLKKSITIVPKAQFVKSVMDIIYSKSYSPGMKNRELNEGVTIMIMRTKEIRALIGETFFKSLLVTLVRAAALVFMSSFNIVIHQHELLSTVLKYVIRNVVGLTTLKLSDLPAHTTSKAVTGTGSEARFASKQNKFFKLKWSGGGIAKEFGIAFTNNITASTLNMKLYPKFKIK